MLTTARYILLNQFSLLVFGYLYFLFLFPAGYIMPFLMSAITVNTAAACRPGGQASRGKNFETVKNSDSFGRKIYLAFLAYAGASLFFYGYNFSGVLDGTVWTLKQIDPLYDHPWHYTIMVPWVFTLLFLSADKMNIKEWSAAQGR